MGKNLPFDPKRPKVSVRLDSDIRDAVQAKASAVGLSATKWIENRVLQALGKAPKWDAVA